MQQNQSVVVLESRLAADARSDREDWSGLASAAERRKIQNRINARASRRRRAKGDDSQASNGSMSPPLDATSSFGNMPAVMPTSNAQSDVVRALEPFRPSNARPETGESICARRSLDVAPSPYADMLLELVAHNLQRAFLANMSSLGYKPLELLRKDLTSPFTHDNLGEAVPGDLKPTALQIAIPHHPVFDLIPDPQLREILISCQGQYDKDDFCHDVVPTPGQGIRDGFIIWSDPCLSDSWEMSEGFFRKWYPLLSGCRRLIESTNRWRAVRREGPIRLQEVK